MKKSTLFISLIAAGVLFGCGEAKTEAKKPATESAEVTSEAPETVTPATPDHYYAMQDGNEYGYERAISQDEQDQGQATNQLVMVKYAGQKDGKHQVYIQDKQTFGVFECSAQCDYMKAMTFFGNEHIKTERLKGGPESVAGAALSDAINGKLEQAKVAKKSDKSKKMHIWFSEESGVELTPIEG